MLILDHYKNLVLTIKVVQQYNDNFSNKKLCYNILFLSLKILRIVLFILLYFIYIAASGVNN